jgi:hypothetical protein
VVAFEVSTRTPAFVAVAVGTGGTEAGGEGTGEWSAATGPAAAAALSVTAVVVSATTVGAEPSRMEEAAEVVTVVTVLSMVSELAGATNASSEIAVRATVIRANRPTDAVFEVFTNSSGYPIFVEFHNNF